MISKNSRSCKNVKRKSSQVFLLFMQHFISWLTEIIKIIYYIFLKLPNILYFYLNLVSSVLFLGCLSCDENEIKTSEIIFEVSILDTFCIKYYWLQQDYFKILNHWIEWLSWENDCYIYTVGNSLFLQMNSF